MKGEKTVVRLMEDLKLAREVRNEPWLPIPNIVSQV